jgi:putative membrane protein
MRIRTLSPFTRAILPAALAITTLFASSAAAQQAAQQGPALTDAGIVAIFDLANTADIETGRLGSQRAQNKEVRDYATMLSQVHTEVRQKGRDLAKKLGVTPALPAGDQMAKQHAAAMEKLGKLSGAEFDRAFLQHEQAYHTAVLDAVKTTLLPAIKNQELKDFVTSLAPAFEAHRLAAEHLEKKLQARGN